MYFEQTESRSKPVTLTSIFGWMALALLMTSAVAIGVYLLLGFGILPATMYYPLLIGSIVGYFIVFIVINYRVIKQNKSAVVPFFVYAAMMGVLLSSIMISTSIEILVLAFGVSALLFGIMAGYGAVTKQNLHPMGSIAIMALFGAVILVPILWIWFNETLYWIVSFVMFGAIMLITAYDVWRMKQRLELGEVHQNTAIFFALQLYVDFINIFIRVVYFLSASRR
ncbi:MAG: Bax inhibitor-1 family protein [Bacilli bacterium]|jgi:hypothetical protein